MIGTRISMVGQDVTFIVTLIGGVTPPRQNLKFSWFQGLINLQSHFQNPLYKGCHIFSFCYRFPVRSLGYVVANWPGSRGWEFLSHSRELRFDFPSDCLHLRSWVKGVTLDLAPGNLELKTPAGRPASNNVDIFSLFQTFSWQACWIWWILVNNLNSSLFVGDKLELLTKVTSHWWSS